MSTLVISPALGMGERIEHRRSLHRRQEFSVLGRLNSIVFDPRGLDPPKVDHAIIQPNMLDWLGKGPWIGVSPDGQDLLVISSVPHPPDLPDTRTKPPTMIPQAYMDRTLRRFEKRFLVFRCVSQILYRPKGVASWGLINVSTGFDDTQMAFLVDPNSGEAHFVGGRFEIGIR
jgi:hypothetical protein